MEKTSTNTYPFVKCLSPLVIRNNYNHKEMMVSCGKCEACLSRKSSMSTLKCRLESRNWLYAKFVTLTYDEDNVPRMHIECCSRVQDHFGNIHELSSPYVYVENQPRLTQDEVKYIYNLQSFESHERLTYKVENEELPYLCKRDVQLFIKRLRRYYDRLQKKLNIPFGQIRYFACGEYGPVHFRPHYHLILWYSCDEVHSTINEAVSSCWKFGRVSTETPRDDVSSYVAKYVNGNCNLPPVFMSAEIKPFTIHSQHLGEQIFQAKKETIYETPVENIVRESLPINGSVTDIYMWRSLKTYYFPRCKMYDLCTSQQRMYAYTLKTKADEYVGNYNLAQQTRIILSYLHDMTRYNITLFGQWHQDPLINDFYRYFIDYCSVDPYQLEILEYYNSAFRSVYMVLRLSKHFLSFCCDNDISNVHKMLSKIESFYLDCDYLNLRNQYIDLEQFAHDWFEDMDEYTLSFSLLPHEITKTRVYRRFKSDTLNRFHKSMKHKILNDANRIYINDK